MVTCTGKGVICFWCDVTFTCPSPENESLLHKHLQYNQDNHHLDKLVPKESILIQLQCEQINVYHHNEMWLQTANNL